jgi:RNA polymerase sigma factor (sigma-70 family)
VDAFSETEAVAISSHPSGADRLARVYQEHATDAIRLAYLLVGDREQAEDLVHDAFTRIIRRFQHRRHPDDFGAYLKRAVVNLAASRARRKRLEARFLERERSFGAARAPVDVDVEQRDLLLGALLGLPYQQRLIVVLRIYEDLSERDVARTLRTSPAAVRSSLHRAMTTLRADLKEHDDERD